MIVLLLIIIALILACGVFGTDDVGAALGDFAYVLLLLGMVAGVVVLCIYLNSRGHR